MKSNTAFFISVFLLFAPFCASAQTHAEEIVIEMHGDPSAAPAAPTLWDADAVQLTRKLRGKTREQVLYAAPVVSDKDRIVRGAKNEYALVEYYDGGDFRKFLFKAESPQTFLAAASTAADVLAINKKYGVNIGLTRGAFENFYGEKAIREENEFLPEGSFLYKLSYTDVNTPKAIDRWFLFEKDALTLTFETSGSKNTHLAALKRQAEKKARAVSAQAAPAQNTRQNRTVRKALISGGTEWDKAYLPRVVNPKPLLVTPTLNPDPNKK